MTAEAGEGDGKGWVGRPSIQAHAYRGHLPSTHIRVHTRGGDILKSGSQLRRILAFKRGVGVIYVVFVLSSFTYSR